MPHRLTRAEILEQVSQIVGDTIDVEGLALQPGMTASDVAGWDSLAHVQIMVAIERAFGIRFRTGEMTSIANVGDLVKRIEVRLAGQT
jgi:acyl carrier protein